MKGRERRFENVRGRRLERKQVRECQIRLDKEGLRTLDEEDWRKSEKVRESRLGELR